MDSFLIRKFRNYQLLEIILSFNYVMKSRILIGVIIDENEDEIISSRQLRKCQKQNDLSFYYE